VARRERLTMSYMIVSDWWLNPGPDADDDERLSFWYFNLRMTFIEHPEARISVTDGVTRIVYERNPTHVVIEREFGLGPDQGGWIGRIQAGYLLDLYEQLLSVGAAFLPWLMSTPPPDEAGWTP